MLLQEADLKKNRWAWGLTWPWHDMCNPGVECSSAMPPCWFSNFNIKTHLCQSHAGFTFISLLQYEWLFHCGDGAFLLNFKAQQDSCMSTSPCKRPAMDLDWKNVAVSIWHSDGARCHHPAEISCCSAPRYVDFHAHNVGWAPAVSLQNPKTHSETVSL